ncbi:MAG TPA: hypothetical protein VHE12_04110 [bacterium]|nr:hypothetical protein [bacterium]
MTTETLDDSKYAKGTGIFSIYEKVEMPADPKKLGTALLEMGNDSLLANHFNILGFIPFPGLGLVGPETVLQFSWILSESHRCLIYNPKTKRLIDELYTCSPEKDGRLMFERMNKLIKKPARTVTLHEIVGKELALKEEPEKLFHSVKKAATKLRFAPDSNYCVSAVFFDIPDRKLDEDTLEVMLTKALNKDDQKPVIEAACRYDPQGYTYIHHSPKHFAGLHSYPGTLKSAHLSLIGTGSAIVSVLEDMEEVVFTRKKSEPTISVKIVADDF